MKVDGTALQECIEKILEYNKIRGWNQAPEDLSKSIVLEGAELLGHFQWDASARRSKARKKVRNLEEIRHEVADIFWYLTLFCKQAKIDLVEALEIKMEHNEKKYPAEMFAGTHNSEFYHAQKKKYRQAKKK